MTETNKRLLLWMIVFCALAAQLHAADAPATKPTSRPAPRTPDSAITPAPSANDLKRHDALMTHNQQAHPAVLFLGDSITDYWPTKGPDVWKQYAAFNPVDLAISGDTTENVLWKIQQGELDGLFPKVVVMLIGTNNIGHYGDEQPQWTAQGVQKILGEVHDKYPDAKILLLAVFPRTGADPRKNPPNLPASTARMMARVNELNGLLAQFDDGGKTRFLDIGKNFLTPDGQMNLDIFPDGLHPNAKGYQIWHDAMDPLLQEMLK